MASNDCSTEPETTPNAVNTQTDGKENTQNDEEVETAESTEKDSENTPLDQTPFKEGDNEALYSENGSHSGSDVEETLFDMKVDTPPQQHKEMKVAPTESQEGGNDEGRQSTSDRLVTCTLQIIIC